MRRLVLSGNEETALRLGAALILGGMIGSNRELHGKPAGLRTHALVSLGAAVATLGFLGAGVILRDPKGHVTGLTTAATIWMCAVLGIVCGLGYWGILAITIGLTAFALLFGRRVERLAERLLTRHESAPTDPSV
jgi:putative Mg2+ transporter-C (MgtC) family protein